MRFKVDENLPVEAAEQLREAGHDAMTVADQNLNGQPDRIIAEAVRNEQRTLVTLDIDFADIRAFPPAEYSGLIVFRLVSQAKPRLLAAVERMIPFLETEQLAGRLWVVDETTLRVRGEPDGS
jgi:predicted nuclease of predicted toxin-antitoxin system